MVNERLQLRSAALCGFCTRLLTARDRWNQFCHVAPVPPAGGSHCQKRCRVVHRDYHLDPHHEAWYCERAASYERGSTATARQHKPTQDTTHPPSTHPHTQHAKRARHRRFPLRSYSVNLYKLLVFWRSTRPTGRNDLFKGISITI